MTTLLLALWLMALPYIGAVLTLPLPGWQMNAPVADWLALLGIVLALAHRRQPVPLPAPRAFLAMLAVGVLAAVFGIQPLPSIKWLVRQPLFLYVAYLACLPQLLAQLTPRAVHRLLLAAVGLTAAVSLASSVPRILSGFGTWWSAIDGLTPNHKTLAVWLAPMTPWLWRHRRDRPTAAVGGLTALALLLASSKAAWLAAGLGLAWEIRLAGRPLVHRWRLTAATLLLGLGLALYAPLLLGSRTMLDAARSRHSLNMRTWYMLREAPLLGQGPGSHLVAEMVEFPHYRVNHVDAHGALQKVAGEQGVLGVLAWLGFTVSLGGAAWRRYSEQPSADGWTWLGVGTVLHFNLLLSTETFTQTHWGLLGVAWWGVHQRSDAR